MTTLFNRYRTPLVTAMLACGLLLCGTGHAAKSASQVAAKVNDQEISVHQINFALARANAGAASPEQAARLRNDVLNRLIDQQLVVEQALDKKLDRSPNVLMALEAARQEVLTRAYFESLSGAIAKPTPEEMKKYYADHPQLFAERRIFAIQELSVQSGDKAIVDQLRTMLTGNKSMDDMAAWLKGNDVKFTGGAANRAAEQIPLELLPRVHALKEGQGMVIQGPKSAVVMRVAGIRQAPVTEEQAMPTIARFLFNQRLKELMASEVKKLRGKAKINYVGEFADAGKAGAAAEKEPTSVTAEPASSSDSIIEKGVAGLK